MEISKVKKVIRGPLAPALTIYKKEDLSLDLDASEKEARHL